MGQTDLVSKHGGLSDILAILVIFDRHQFLETLIVWQHAWNGHDILADSGPTIINQA